MISVGLGSLVHRLFKGKPEMQWDPPEWIGITQMLIIQGLIWGTIFGVLGGILGWHWLIGLGSFLKYIFGTLLGLDILVLIILGTIHGYFDVFGEQ